MTATTTRALYTTARARERGAHGRREGKRDAEKEIVERQRRWEENRSRGEGVTEDSFHVSPPFGSERQPLLTHCSHFFPSSSFGNGERAPCMASLSGVEKGVSLVSRLRISCMERQKIDRVNKRKRVQPEKASDGGGGGNVYGPINYWPTAVATALTDEGNNNKY